MDLIVSLPTSSLEARVEDSCDFALFAKEFVEESIGLVARAISSCTIVIVGIVVIIIRFMDQSLQPCPDYFHDGTRISALDEL